MTENDANLSTNWVAEYNTSRPIKSYIEVVLWVVKDTRGFFRHIPVKAGYMAPALFTLISYLVPGLVVSFISQSPLASLLYLLVMSGWLLFVILVHLAVTRLMDGKAPFEATFRAAAYASFTNLVGPVPYLGLATHIFGLYLTAHAVSTVHGITFGRAAAALLLVVSLLMLTNLMLAGFIVSQLQ